MEESLPSLFDIFTEINKELKIFDNIKNKYDR